MLRKIPDDIHVTLLGKQIYPVSSAKDLGIIIDASLTYDEHLTNWFLNVLLVCVRSTELGMF